MKSFKTYNTSLSLLPNDSIVIPGILDSNNYPIFDFVVEAVSLIKVTHEICDKLNIHRRYHLELSYQDTSLGMTHITALCSVDPYDFSMNIFFPDTHFTWADPSFFFPPPCQCSIPYVSFQQI